MLKYIFEISYFTFKVDYIFDYLTESWIVNLMQGPL